jgi:glycosyltransferase involved in cell wall biosynthesis
VEALGVHVPDLICLSHLRWDWVFQRPQHLMVRFARERRVFFVEEPWDTEGPPRLDVRVTTEGVHVVVPHVPARGDATASAELVRALVDELVSEYAIRAPVLWYYTPMALAWARHIPASAVVYDCMDELSAFAGAAEGLRRREVELIARADIVTTGGASLYEAKRHRHGNVHLFPSSVDVPHFAQARRAQADPPDQATIARPRLGYFGVIDERMDLDLLAGLAAMRPHWQVVLVGPTAKIDEATLPRGANIHYLGRKPYDVLPAYLAGWDVALLPFARNEATRYISPTKTPEYLAAGRPVVSTSIRDVVRPYGERGVVRIADAVEDFVAAVDACLAAPDASRDTADGLLRGMSWDATWSRMRELVAEACAAATPAAA